MRNLYVDIGVHNTALYVEDFDHEYLKSELTHKKIFVPKSKRGNPKKYWEPTDEFIKMRKLLYSIGEFIFLDMVDLLPDVIVKNTDFNINMFVSLTNYLDSKKHVIDNCDEIVIEQQVKQNPNAQRLEQHVVSWITFRYGNTKTIIIYGGKHKYRELFLPRKVLIPKKQKKIKGKDKDATLVLQKTPKEYRKKIWGPEQTKELLLLRNDKETIEYIYVEHHTKKDDACDVILMAQAHKIRKYVDDLN